MFFCCLCNFLWKCNYRSLTRWLNNTESCEGINRNWTSFIQFKRNCAPKFLPECSVHTHWLYSTLFSPCTISVATHGPPSTGNVIWHCKGINIKRSVWLEFRSMKCWNQGGRKEVEWRKARKTYWIRQNTQS